MVWPDKTNSVNSVNHVNSANSVNSVNIVNSVNSVNSYSAVLPPSPMVFCETKIHLGGEEDTANEAKCFVDGQLGHLAVESSVLK